jgi:cytoskeleton protein RodZ
MNHLGERLRQQRLAMGVSLQHISEKTRIGSRYLEALEAGQFKQLPGAIFARSFVRQYAELVGIDANGLESELQQIFPSDDGFPSQEAPSTGALKTNLPNDTLLAAHGPIWQQLPLTTIWLASALGVSSLFYIGWQQMVLRSETREPPVVMQVPAKPPVLKSPGVQADPPPLSSSVVPAAVRSNEPSPQTDTAKPATELVAPAGQGGPTMALRLVASEETWVSIAANGRFLFSGILQPHEERTVNGVETARMVIGNSAGVEVLTDGRSIGPIGPQGSVRVVMLTPGNPPQIGQNVDMPSTDPKNDPPQPEATATPVSTKLD